MAKPPRSPLLGYNHNLTHLGRIFHIQTEDSGPVTPRLFTHLFYEGTILASRKHEYDASLPDDQVRGLMQLQHKTVMKDLLRARLDAVIVPFFAARGVDLAPVTGALPTAALSETPGPVMMLPHAGDESAPSHGPKAMEHEPIPHAPPEYDGRADRVDAVPRVPPAASAPRRTATRPIDTSFQRGQSSNSVVVRSPESRSSPFVRSGPPAATRMSSADGVVVQRNVVVGGGAASSSRSARIRPPVPYVVTGGGHTERPPRPAASGTPAPGSSGIVSAGSNAPSQPTPAPSTSAAVSVSSGEVVSRSAGGFGVGLPDDKSLDEVILEYLSEDGDPG